MWFIEHGSGGWVRAWHIDYPSPIYASFVQGADGRLHMTDVCTLRDDGRPFSPAEFAELPLWVVEHRVNQHAAESGEHGAAPPDPAPASALRALFDEPERNPWTASKRKRARATAPPPARLDVPPARPYGDEFYRQVAEVYNAVVAHGGKPGPAIAEANEVPVSTSHGWIREARRRGHLAPGRKGRAG